ncbi:hypothetical protein LTR04_005627 [Oleoguttula sp. CCFEE 6159]|nr:hypothetical protein LTR04_005627 [Oleoguttula sp. CCFEE 6159]
MDIFRILSRSTNLSKGGTKKTVSQRTPSSGESSNPRSFANAAENNGAVSRKKRKRGQHDAAAVPVKLPAELDFFGESSSRRESDNRNGDSATKTKGKIEKEEGEAIAEEQEDFADSSGTVLTEEECMQVLRSHKIKITQLGQPVPRVEEPKQDRKKSKKRKKEIDDAVAEALPHKKVKLQLYPEPLTSFDQLRSRYKVSRRLAENVDAQGFTTPTEVQLGSLPLLLEATGIDLLTVAPTGSGKTLAFLIPTISALLQERQKGDEGDIQREDNKSAYSGPKAIVVAPTKELASQIVNEGRKLVRQTGVRITLMRKGMQVAGAFVDDESLPHRRDEHDDSDDGSASDSAEDATTMAYGQNASTKARAGSVVKADIIVSTPLTLVNAIKTKDGHKSFLGSVRHLVLDEADVLLDPLFRTQTLDIWHACTNPLLRVSLWSATMGSNIEELARSTINHRWEALPFASRAAIQRPGLVRLVVGLKDSAIPSIDHKLTYAATEQGKLMALRQLLHPSSTSADAGPALRPPFLVFTQTIARAVALHSELLYDIPPEAGGSSRIAVLHSDLSDTARDRIMTRFRKGEVWVLITTDLLARGVDFRGVNGVVNYDVPNSGAAYVHRVGRTGRAGREGGVAVTLYTKEDIPYIKNIANIIAASEKQKGAKGAGQGVQQWLLDALPNPSKRDKQMMKKRGVEARRTGSGREGAKGQAHARISTKSGFERRRQNNRKGAVAGSRGRQSDPRDQEGGSDGEEFGGFDD